MARLGSCEKEWTNSYNKTLTVQVSIPDPSSSKLPDFELVEYTHYNNTLVYTAGNSPSPTVLLNLHYQDCGINLKQCFDSVGFMASISSKRSFLHTLLSLFRGLLSGSTQRLFRRELRLEYRVLKSCFNSSISGVQSNGIVLPAR